MPKTKEIAGQKQNRGNQHTAKAIVATEHLPGREIFSLDGVPDVLNNNHDSVEYWHEHSEPERQSGKLNANTMPIFIMCCSAWGAWMDWKRIEAGLRKNKPANRGKIVVNGEKAKLTVTAKEIPAAEKHFAGLLSKYEEIAARYAKPENSGPVWPD